MKERRIGKTYKVRPSVHKRVGRAAEALRAIPVYGLLSGYGGAQTTQSDIIDNALSAEVDRLEGEYNHGRPFPEVPS